MLGDISGPDWTPFSDVTRFGSLLGLAVVLLTLSAIFLPETQVQQAVSEPEVGARLSLLDIAKTMVVDKRLWLNSALIALFNIMLFSYYSLAPFAFSVLVLLLLTLAIVGLCWPLAVLLAAF